MRPYHRNHSTVFQNHEYSSCFPTSLWSFRLILNLAGPLISLDSTSYQLSISEKNIYKKLHLFSISLQGQLFDITVIREKYNFLYIFVFFWLKIIILCIQIILQSIIFTLDFIQVEKPPTIFFIATISWFPAVVKKV